MSHPSFAVSVRRLSLDFPVHTFLPFSPVLKAHAPLRTRIAKFGCLAKSALNSHNVGSTTYFNVDHLRRKAEASSAMDLIWILQIPPGSKGMASRKRKKRLVCVVSGLVPAWLCFFAVVSLFGSLLVPSRPSTRCVQTVKFPYDAHYIS